MYSKCICGMFCSCVQKYDLISVRCRVDTGRGAATTGHCHRRVPGPCAASSHHTGPVLTSTIDHYSPIEISEILKSLLDPARARDNAARSVVVSLDVKFRILQPPSSSYPGPSLYSVSSF